VTVPPEEYEIGELPPPPLTAPTHKDHVRKYIAYFLVGVFAMEVLLAFTAFLLGRNLDEIKGILLEVIGPTSALVGSVVGFYFGSDRS
jgi:hypothetical protein